MCRYTQLLILILAIAAAPFVALGQKHYEGPGNWFVGIDAGVALALNENVTGSNFLRTKIPSGSITFGRTLTPFWGVRLSSGFYPQFGYPHKKAVDFDSEMFSPYQYFVASGSLDLMLNLSNLCRIYDVRNWFDAYFIAGGGMLYSFGMDKKVDEWPVYIYPVDSKEQWYWNAKVGLMGAWHVHRAFDFTAELDCFFTDNAYNGVADSHSLAFDLFTSFRVGVVYYFRNSQHRHRYANPLRRQRYWKDI